MVDRDTEIYLENNMTKFFIAKNDIKGISVPKGSFMTLFAGNVSAVCPDGTYLSMDVSPEAEVSVLAPNMVPARNVLWRKKDGTGECVQFKMAKSFLQQYEPIV